MSMEYAFWVKVDKSSQEMREADTIRRECGGEMDKVPCTTAERKEFVCGHDKDNPTSTYD